MVKVNLSPSPSPRGLVEPNDRLTPDPEPEQIDVDNVANPRGTTTPRLGPFVVVPLRSHPGATINVRPDPAENIGGVRTEDFFPALPIVLKKGRIGTRVAATNHCRIHKKKRKAWKGPSKRRSRRLALKKRQPLPPREDYSLPRYRIVPEEMEQIVGRKVENGRVFYLVKWGPAFPGNVCTWEPLLEPVGRMLSKEEEDERVGILRKVKQYDSDRLKALINRLPPAQVPAAPAGSASVDPASASIDPASASALAGPASATAPLPQGKEAPSPIWIMEPQTILGIRTSSSGKLEAEVAWKNVAFGPSWVTVDFIMQNGGTRFISEFCRQAVLKRQVEE